MNRNRRILSKLLLTLAAGMLCLVGIELVLRAAFKDGPAPLIHDRPLITFYPSGERLHAWSRGHDDPLRIAVVGDSITHGAGCQFYDTYGMRLEALLNHNDGQRPALVRVWARGGDSTYTQLRYLRDITPWKPELLILGICLNDTEDLRAKDEYHQWRLETLPPPPSPLLARILPRTQLGTILYQRHATATAIRGYHRYYERLYATTYSGWDLFMDSIRGFRDICMEHNIAFLPVIFPTFDNVDRYPFEWIHTQIGTFLQAEGIQFVDLLDTFRGLSPQRLQAIPAIDAHPSEIAHRLAAETIFHFLLANQLVDKGYLPQHASASPEQMWRALAQFYSPAAAVDQKTFRRFEDAGD